MVGAALLLSAALLVGIGSSHNLGEQGLAFAAAAEAQRGAFAAEVTFDTSDKIETGDGWLIHGAADYWDGPLSLGVAYTRRETSAWHKDVFWARASARHGILRFVAEVAPLSDRMEAMGEVRITLRHRRIVVEPRLWTGWHTTAEELGGFAYGISMLIGAVR